MIRITDSSESLWLEVRYRIKFDLDVGECSHLQNSLNRCLESPETVIAVSQISEVGPWLYEVVQIMHLEYPDLTMMKHWILKLWGKVVGQDIHSHCLDLTVEWSKEVDQWYAELM